MTKLSDAIVGALFRTALRGAVIYGVATSPDEWRWLAFILGGGFILIDSYISNINTPAQGEEK